MLPASKAAFGATLELQVAYESPVLNKQMLMTATAPVCM
jgi:hypothetical protein